MATSEVDMKFLGQFADNIQLDHPFLAQNLFQILGNLVMLSEKVIRARKLRRLDTTRDTKSVDLYCRIIWYAREGLKLLEEYVLPMVANYGELKVLAYKLRASFYHLYVLFHNQPSISLKSAQLSTPPGLKSPRNNKVPDTKGKNVDRSSPRSSPTNPIHRPSSVQPTHPLEGGPVRSPSTRYHTPPPPPNLSPSFLVPPHDYRPLALHCFQDATILAERILWGSHPLRLSVKVEYAAFLYDCLHEKERSRHLAKVTIQEVYNAQEGMDDDMFEDAADMVAILGKMVRRGEGASSGGGSEKISPPTRHEGGGSAKISPPSRREERERTKISPPSRRDERERTKISPPSRREEGQHSRISPPSRREEGERPRISPPSRRDGGSAASVRTTPPSGREDAGRPKISPPSRSHGGSGDSAASAKTTPPSRREGSGSGGSGGSAKSTPSRRNTTSSRSRPKEGHRNGNGHAGRGGMINPI